MNEEAPLPRTVARLMAQELPFEVAARELRAPASVIRQASGADGRISFSDAVTAAVAFYRAKISDDAFEAALRPARRGPPPGLYGTPRHLRRLRTQAVSAATPLVTEIDRQTRRLTTLALTPAPDGPADARRVARLADQLDRLAAALAKRNARAVRGLGPKQVKA